MRTKITSSSSKAELAAAFVIQDTAQFISAL